MNRCRLFPPRKEELQQLQRVDKAFPELQVMHQGLRSSRTQQFAGPECPTRNVFAVQTVLHRIEGLSERFVYVAPGGVRVRHVDEPFGRVYRCCSMAFSGQWRQEMGSKWHRNGIEMGLKVVSQLPPGDVALQPTSVKTFFYGMKPRYPLKASHQIYQNRRLGP